MIRIFCLSLCHVLVAAVCLASGPEGHAVALIPTPVLNTPEFAAVFGGSDRQTLRTDHCAQLRSLEFIALPGTPFRIEATIAGKAGTVYRVSTEDYPYATKTGYYIDSRFVALTSQPPPPRRRSLPSRDEVVADLLAAQGSRYVWGSNVRAGVPQMPAFFPARSGARLAEQSQRLWQLQGVDCSGLLYEATGGFTPRNTSALVTYGKPVPVAGLKGEEIVRRMEPLDLIVWNGHVMIVLDRERLIESRLDCTGGNGGVSVRPLRAALDQLLISRVPLDEHREPGAGEPGGFVVRRWYEAVQ